MSTRDPRLPSLITLSSIVSEVMSDTKDFTAHDRLNYKKWAIRGLEDINLTLPVHVVSDLQVERLELSSVNTAELPPDFIDWKVIGYDIHGQVHGMVSNPDIAILDKPSCDTSVNPNVDREPPTIPDHFGAMAGIAMNDFRIITDAGRKIIQFNNRMPISTIYVEYISSGISLHGETFVERMDKAALIAYIHWMRVDNDNSVPANEKMRKERMFYDRKRELYYMRNPYTAKEIINAFRAGYAQTPKR